MSSFPRGAARPRALAHAAAGAVAVALALAVCRAPQASNLPPWRDQDDLPLPDGVASVRALRDDVPILRTPSAVGERRGTALAGERLPLFGAKRGSGCAARWINVGPWAWICQDAVAFDAEPPVSAEPTGEPPDGLPYRYYYVGRQGSAGYSRLEDAEQVAPDREFDPGFAVALLDETMRGGERFGRTHHGLWLPMRDLVPISPSKFRGKEIEDGKLDFGWVAEDRTPVFPSAPGAKTAPPKAARTIARLERIAILEQAPEGAPVAYRIGENEWVRARDVRKPALSPPPAAARPGERWLDVDLASQTLVAYEGERPVFATLVSTGRGREGTDTATPKGEHRIWVKLLTSNMDNLEDSEAEHYYAIEDVPYVQYFASGVGLHGAFWHQGFGHVRSHGCVNLSPLDAQRIFRFTSPHLPSGWSAVLPTPHEQGTFVRVR